MIEAQDLCRHYGDFTAVEGFSFAAEEGEILGLLGPNGAGKTTAIRMMTGFLPPTSGRVSLGGKDLWRDGAAVKRELGYLPENVALYPEMRVYEYLRYRARLVGLPRSSAREAIGRALEACLLDEVRDQVIGTLSKGFRQRVGLAAAILHDPRVLVLDEPTVGLDPKQIIAIRHLIRELGHRRTLVLSTHILPEVELLCDRVLILDRGHIVDQGTPASLRERWMGSSALRVQLEGEPAGVAEGLAALPGVETVRGAGAGWQLDCARGADPRADVFRLAVARGWVLLELAEQRVSLEDIFVRLTTQDATAVEESTEEDGPKPGSPPPASFEASAGEGEERV